MPWRRPSPLPCCTDTSPSPPRCPYRLPMRTKAASTTSSASNLSPTQERQDLPTTGLCTTDHHPEWMHTNSLKPHPCLEAQRLSLTSLWLVDDGSQLIPLAAFRNIQACFFSIRRPLCQWCFAVCCHRDRLLGRLWLFSFLLSPPWKTTSHLFIHISELARYLRLEKLPLAAKISFPHTF